MPISTLKRSNGPSKSVTKENLLKTLRGIPHAEGILPSRVQFRAACKMNDSAWTEYWPTFSDFKREAFGDQIHLSRASASRSVSSVLPPLEVEKERIRERREGLKSRVKILLDRNIALEKELSEAKEVMGSSISPIHIPTASPSGESESVAVAVWSDWHVEESVTSEASGGKNVFNPGVASNRVNSLAQTTGRLLSMFSRDTKINRLVVGLLGDFISNRIHEDLAESNAMPPTDAIHFAEGLISGALTYLLKNTPKDMIIEAVCHTGNHGRLTQKQRGNTEAGNSLERFMYLHLATLFEKEPRIKFHIPTGYYSTVSLFDGAYVMRMHHGHAIRYGGGIGGITVPVLKSIANWNTADRNVNLDVFGHFHTYMDADSFVSNGSLIGRNDYAVRIGATYQQPQQSFFLINRHHNTKSIVAPVFLS